jgi:hypothetical protein
MRYELHHPARYPGESYQDYRKRRLTSKEALKAYKRGKITFLSKYAREDADGNLMEYSSTYRRGHTNYWRQRKLMSAPAKELRVANPTMRFSEREPAEVAI